MRKILSIAVGLAIGAGAVAPARAESSPAERIIAQERARSIVAQQSEPSPIERLIAQERARRADPRLAGTPVGPVQVVSRSSGFDWGDAGIAATATLAVSLLALGGMTLRAARLNRV